MTTVSHAMERLEALGHEKVRARNLTLGAGEAQFGVRMGDVRMLAKEVGRDHELAMELWATGHLELHLLSILLLDPKQLSADELEAMLHDVRYAHLADRLQSYVAKDHAEAGLRREAWMDDPTRGWPAPVGASRPGG